MRRSLVLPLLALFVGCSPPQEVDRRPIPPKPKLYVCCDGVPDYDDECVVGSPVRKKYDKTAGQCMPVEEG